MTSLLSRVITASALVLSYVLQSLAADADAWRSRSIYQVITDRFALPKTNPPLPTDQCNVAAQTWCGGTWASIEQNLDYIQDMGFTAVWISPVSQNIPGPTAYGDPYHGYWVQNVTQLNDRFGTSDDLKSLISALHSRNMYIMVDIVVNNVAATTSTFTPDYSPYLFTNAEYYHPYAPIQWGNATSEQVGWLGDAKLPLPDLNTSHPVVRQELQAYVKTFVGEYNVDGLRIDAAKHVEPSFWSSFCNENGAAGVFCIGEVYGPDVGLAATWQGPLDSVLNYPTYYALVNAFTIPGPANISGLVEVYTQSRKAFKDVTVLGNFLGNQDLPRWAGISVDPMSLANALVFSFMTEGIPVVYYGTEQGFTGQSDPGNREPLWPSGYKHTTTHDLIASLNQFRNFLTSNITTNSQHPWLNQKSRLVQNSDVEIVINKGGVISIMNALGSPPSNHTMSIMSTGYTTNTMLTDILSCSTYVVASNGALAVTYSQGAHPLILYPNSWLTDSGICGNRATPTGSQAGGNWTMPGSTSARCDNFASTAVLAFAITTTSLFSNLL